MSTSSKISPRRTTNNLIRAASTALISVRLGLFPKKKYAPLSGRRDGVVLSFTTFPRRMSNVWKTLDSLMRQKCRPDRIVMALTEEEFPDRDLPSSLDPFIEAGLEIVFLPYNYRCHNKYFYAMQAYPEATVVTTDDDSYYRKDLISKLMTLHEKYPEAVCANISNVISKENYGCYSAWKKTDRHTAPTHGIIALGFGAVLYPKTFRPALLFDEERITRLCPTADDLWLKAVETVSGTKVCCGGYYPRPVTLPGSQKVALRKINKGSVNRNDIQWAALEAEFGLKEKIF